MGEVETVILDFYIHHRFVCNYCKGGFTAVESPRPKAQQKVVRVQCPYCKAEHPLKLKGELMAVSKG